MRLRQEQRAPGRLRRTIASGGVVALLAGLAVATGGSVAEAKDIGVTSGKSSSMALTTMTKATLTVTGFKPLIVDIPELRPQAATGIPETGRISAFADAFTPRGPAATKDQWIVVRGTGKSNSMTCQIPAWMMNTTAKRDVYRFEIHFDEPMVDPVINISGQSAITTTGSKPVTLSQSVSDALSFSNAVASGGGTTPFHLEKVSGFDSLPGNSYQVSNSSIGTDDYLCRTSGSGCVDAAADLARVRSYVPGASGVTTAMAGTFRIATQGKAITSITVTASQAWMDDSTKSGRYRATPAYAIQLVAPSEVSAMQRWLGKCYGDAVHAMPMQGEDNLHLGATIVEGNVNRYVKYLNSGLSDADSVPGYDGLTFFYFVDDPAKTPVTTVYRSDAGRKLATDVVVSGAQNRTAYVRGFIDFLRKGSFVHSTHYSTLETVPGGNGVATLVWTVPKDIKSGDLPIRLRTSYDSKEIKEPTGGAKTGEVEDYRGMVNGSTETGGQWSLAKSLNSELVPGETSTWTISVTNPGKTATTSPLTITDTFPAQLTNVRIDGAAPIGTASVSGNTITWTIPAGPAGGNYAVKVLADVRTDVALGTLVTNTASAVGPCKVCTATAKGKVTGTCGKLSISKAAPATARTGETITYTVTVIRSDKTATVVTDQIPAGLDLASVGAITTSSGTASLTGSTLRWSLPALKNPGPETLSFQATVTASAGTTITNTATIPADKCKSKCSASATTTIVDSGATLTLTKTPSAAIVRPGESITYDLVVTNDGTVPLSAVAVTDTDPAMAGLPVVCPGGGNTIATLAAGESVTCTVTKTFSAAEMLANVAEWSVDGFTNTAQASGRDAWGAVVTASASATVAIDHGAAVQLTKEVTTPTGPAKAGDTIGYTVTAEATGSFDILVTDFYDFKLDGIGSGFTTSFTCDTDLLTSHRLVPGTVVTCQATYQLTEQDVRDGWATGSFRNTVNLRGEVDGWPGATVDAEASADLPIDQAVPMVSFVGAKIASTAASEPGRTVSYTVWVANLGQTTATGVQVLDAFKGGAPAALAPALCSWPQATAGVLAPGEVVICTYDYTVTMDDINSTITNIAYAQGWNGSLPVGPVEVGRASVTVGAGSELSITKSNDAAARVRVGDTFGYEITVANLGSAAAPGVVVSDTLPAGLEFDPIVQSPWVITGTTATYPAMNLAAGESRTLTLSVRVAAGATGKLTNVAVIGDRDPADCLTDATLAGCGVDPNGPTVDGSEVTWTKSMSPAMATVRPGTWYSYRFTATNAGSGPAVDVRLSDTLPDGLEFAYANQPGWVISGRTATATVGSIPAGGQATLVLVVRVTDSVTHGQVLLNVAAEGDTAPGDCVGNPTGAGCVPDTNPPTVEDVRLVATKTPDRGLEDQVDQGTIVTYTITVRNEGSVPATDVWVIDQLPLELEFTDTPGAGWTIDPVARTATITGLSLAPKGSPGSEFTTQLETRTTTSGAMRAFVNQLFVG